MVEIDQWTGIQGFYIILYITSRHCYACGGVVVSKMNKEYINVYNKNSGVGFLPQSHALKLTWNKLRRRTLTEYTPIAGPIPEGLLQEKPWLEFIPEETASSIDINQIRKMKPDQMLKLLDIVCLSPELAMKLGKRYFMELIKNIQASIGHNLGRWPMAMAVRPKLQTCP